MTMLYDIYKKSTYQDKSFNQMAQNGAGSSCPKPYFSTVQFDLAFFCSI